MNLWLGPSRARVLGQLVPVCRRFMFSQTLVVLVIWLGPSTVAARDSRSAIGWRSCRWCRSRWADALAPCSRRSLRSGSSASVAMVVAGAGAGHRRALRVRQRLAGFVGATRWLRRIPYWPLALPLVLVGPVGVCFVVCALGGGWRRRRRRPRASLGLAAVAFQPRAWLGVGSEAQTRRGRAQVVARPGIARQAVSSPERGKASWLRAAARFLRLVHRPTIVLDLFMFPLTALCIVLFHFPGLVADARRLLRAGVRDRRGVRG